MGCSGSKARVAAEAGDALATLPPRLGGDFTGERAVWKGKFYIE